VTPPTEIASYRIERLLGIGSFATVWLGFDRALGARVAIKVLAENWSHDLRVRERFLDEARMLWRLDHERVVRVHSLGELSDGRPYLVMAWAQGGSLRDRLAAGPLSVGGSLSLLREITAGAAVLHRSGIVHRDLTPGNILFRHPARDGRREEFSAGEVLIADLGLAKALAAASGLTARAGTPGFMAPEQDDPLAIVDERADVFGLGRLGAMLLCVPAGRSSGSPAPLRYGVPPRVAAVLRKATAHRPVDRYRDAAAFAVALGRATRHWVPGGPARGYVTGRRRLRAALAALVLIVLIAATATGADRARSTIGADATGHITVTLPSGWRVDGSGWIGPGGVREPALLMSPDPGRWSDGTVPGVFVGLSTGSRETPHRFVADHPHAGCFASPVRSSRQSGVDWVVAEFTSCRTGMPVIVEAAAAAPDAGLLYLQMALPAGSGPEFVDRLLAGVGVVADRA
jgi:eukaryotic-like serine/threonine-protein kinase